jgi:hypothetical protein
MKTFGLLLLSASLCISLQAQTPSSAVAPSSGKAMCSALNSSDFSKAGVPVTRLREANSDDENSAYCVYDSKAAGKVEFDIFYPAGSTPDEIKNTERTVLAEVGGKFDAVQVTGVDQAQTNVAAPKDPTSPTIAARKGKAVFDISVPQGPNVRQQLITLAQTVAGRLKP